MARFRNKGYGGRDFTANYESKSWTCGLCKRTYDEKEKKINICKRCIKRVGENGKS